MIDRKYFIINFSECDKVDFSQVLETDKDTLRLSLDKTKTILKFETESAPSFFDTINSKEGPYSYDEILKIIAGPDWTYNEIIIPDNLVIDTTITESIGMSASIIETTTEFIGSTASQNIT